MRRDHLLLIPLLAAACAFGLGYVWSADLWWYLASGREILAQGGIPERDVFVYSLDPPAPWLTHSWLWTVALAAVERAFGLAALPILSTTLVVALLVLLHGSGRIDRYGSVNALLGFLVLMAGCYRFSLRAELPGWLLFLLFLRLLERTPRRPADLALLVSLEVLWANLHGSFVLGIVLGACHAVGSFLERRLPGRGGGEPAPGPSPWLVPLLAVAPVATPGLGADRLADVANALRGLGSDAAAPGALAIIEWASPWSGQFTAQPPALHAAFVAIGIASFAVVRPPRRLSRALVFLSMALLGALSLRFLAGFAIATAFVALRNLEGAELRVRVPALAQAAFAAALAALLAAVAAGTWLSRSDYEVGQSADHAFTLNPRNLAPGAADYIDRHELPGPIFNELLLGGYLAWRLYPEHLVFVDGRILDERLWHEHRQILLGRAWRRALRERGFNLVVLSNLAQDHLPLRRLLRADPEWKLVYLDPQAVVFARSAFALPAPELHASGVGAAAGGGAPFVGDPGSPGWRRWAARPLLDGSSLFLLHTFLEALLELGLADEAEALASRAIAADVGGVALHGQRGRALLQLGRPADALPELARVAEAWPESAAALFDHAVALAGAGERDAALAALDRALALDPTHRPAARLRHRLRERGEGE